MGPGSVRRPRAPHRASPIGRKPLSQNLSRYVVTAVVVAHDGARWLPDTLKGLLSQHRPVQRIVGVDTGSRDRGRSVLHEVLGEDAIVTLPRETGYGAALAEALRQPAANTPVQAIDPVEWIWLLHDDSAPAHDALHHLLLAAADDQRARVVGPKVRDWLDRRMLLEVGVTIDGAGRRETGLEPRELDQGQQDGNREVLAVGSAGMLIRRDIWEELGGFDAALPLFRDDIDFCWRVNSAGHRVAVATDAIVYHAEASARRRRPTAATGDHPRRVDRRNALYVLFANLPAGALALALIRNVFGSLLRTLMYLVGKQPGSALDELAALASAYGRPFKLIGARRRRARTRRRTYSAIRPFLARGAATRRLAEMAANLMSGDGAMDSSGSHRAGALPGEPEDEDDDPLRDDGGLLRRVFTHPGVLLVLALGLVTLVACRSLLTGGRLGGGALVPVAGGASDLWRLYVSGWHDTGMGTDGTVPPYVAVIAALSTVLLGKVWAAVGLLLLGSVPLAGFTAYLLARRVGPGKLTPLWPAAAYALLPIATGAVAAGRLGTAVTFALLPLLGLAAAGILTEAPRRARRAAWATVVFLAVGTAFTPLLWVLAVLLAALLAVVARWSPWSPWTMPDTRDLVTNLAIAVTAPLALLFPWTLRLFTHPTAFLLEAGLHRPGLADPLVTAESLLLLGPGGPGTPPIWVTAGLAVTALGALLLRRRRGPVLAGWLAAGVGLPVAVLVSLASPKPLDGGPPAAAWPGVALAVAGLGLVVAVAASGPTIAGLYRDGGWRRWAACAVGVVVATPAVTAAAVWMWSGAAGPVTKVNTPVMPAFLAAQNRDGTAPRTLVLRPAAYGIDYTVLRGRAPLLGEAEVARLEPVGSRLDAVVTGLASGRAGDDGRELAAYGIRFVLLPAPIDRRMQAVFDGSPGLSRVSVTPRFALWRVTEPAGRLRLVAGGQAPVVLKAAGVDVTAAVPAGPEGRTAVLAESADGGWSATLNGAELRPVTVAGWAQGFELPASGGTLEITRGTFLYTTALLLQGLLVLVAVVLALPAARSEEEGDPDAEVPRPRGERKGRRGGAKRARGKRGSRRRGDAAEPPPPPRTTPEPRPDEVPETTFWGAR
ncbi:MAG: glycosyltransferase [Streptosporangiales bacterium]|nr:glycosyltransferase [Streptosporangiales bacterium]